MLAPGGSISELSASFNSSEPVTQPGTTRPFIGVSSYTSSANGAGEPHKWPPTTRKKTALDLHLDDLKKQGKADGLDDLAVTG